MNGVKLMAKRTVLKKLLAVSLAFSAAVSCAVTGASAAVQTKDGMIDYEFDFKYITSGYTDDNRTTTTRSHPALIKKLREAYMNFEDTIDVSEWKLSRTEMNGITIIVRGVYPELFFVEGNNWKYEGSGDNEVVTKLYPRYIYKNNDGTADKEKINAELKAFYAEADRYMAMLKGRLNPYSDDFSKVLFLHDEMALDFQYAYDKRSSENNGDYVPFNEYNNYEMMINKDGVCRHYSEVYAYVLGQLGIRTELISTPASSKKDSSGRAGLEHQWTKVELDGSWYNVDLTWDDISSDKKPVRGQVWHNNYLFSDAAFEAAGHYGYKTLNSSDNTKYDTAPFHQYISRCCKLSPDSTLIYAIKWENKSYDVNNEYAKNWYLVSYDYITGEEKKLRDMSDEKWYSYVDNTASVKSYPQTSLDSYGRLLFYNTSRELHCFDTLTNEDKVVSVIKSEYKGQIFGLRIKNNALCYYYGEADSQTGRFNIADTKEYITGYYQDYAVPAESVALEKATVSTGVGSVVDLAVEVTPDKAADILIWESSDPTVAEVKDGVVTTKKAGKATIKVRSIPNGKTASCRVIVNNGPTGVELNKTAAAIYKGSVLQLTATVSPESSKSKKVTWKSSDPTVASVDKTGKATAKKAGKAVITATTALNSKVASCEVTVVLPVNKIKLNKTSLSLEKGKTAQLTASVYPSAAYDKTVTWKSTNALVASVDQTGKVTAKGAGTATIKARASNGRTAVCTVKVTIPVTKITLNKSAVSVKKGNSFQLKATVLPAKADDKTVTWKSLNPKIASVDQTGKVTALAKGTAVIKAKAKNGISASCTVTVKIPAKAVSLDKTSAVMYPGDTLSLTAVLTPASSTDVITWSSLNTDVAQVSSSGVVTAWAEGSAKICAKATSGKCAYCTVTVKKKTTKVSRIAFEPSEYTTYKNSKFCISDLMRYYPADANEGLSFSYSSSNDASLHLYMEDGKVYAETYSYTGVVTVTVRSESGLTASVKVTIKNQISGTVEFSVKTGTMKVSTSNGRIDVTLGHISTVVYGGKSTTITYQGYKYLIEAYSDGSARITETAPDGAVKKYSVGQKQS